MAGCTAATADAASCLSQVRVAALGLDFRPRPIPEPLYDELNALVETHA